MRVERAGFTLVELLVALSIGAVVLAGARTLLEGLADHATATVRAARSADTAGNAERLVRQVVSNVALAPELQPTFTGTASEATFGSWCPAAWGGLESCRARLAIRMDGAAPAVVLSLSTGEEVALAHGAPARLRYLADAGNGGRWYAQWNDLLTPPLAVGVLAGADTLLLRIGERR
jgi:prepilin-type N-terminal cleavage/methylation domain-containing protein